MKRNEMSDSTTDTVELINSRRAGFSKLLGLIVTEATPDCVKATLEVRNELCTRPEVLHGGAIMAFADNLGALACILNLPEGASTTTLESKTNFLSSIPMGQTAYAETTGDDGVFDEEVRFLTAPLLEEGQDEVFEEAEAEPLTPDEIFRRFAPRLLFLDPFFSSDAKLAEDIRLEVRLVIKNALKQEGSFRVRTMGDLELDDEALFNSAKDCKDNACLFEALNNTAIGHATNVEKDIVALPPRRRSASRFASARDAPACTY